MAAASHDPRPRTLLSGRYTLSNMLGDHAGDVFAARRNSDGHAVVLRCWRADTAQASSAFLDVARAAMRVRHPSLASVEACGDVEHVCFIVSELAPGDPLDAWADKVGVPSFANVIDVARKLCAVLQAAQRVGLTHDALHPRNVFAVQHAVGPAQRVQIKLLDLGVPAFVRPSLPSAFTAQFMAPEQLAATLSVGTSARPSADSTMNVYSIGCLLYYLCTGGAPFQSSSLDELREAHAEGKLVTAARLNPLVPPALDALITRTLAVAPRERIQSVSELADSLANLDLTSASGVRPTLAAQSQPPQRAAVNDDSTGRTFDETPTLTTQRPPRARSETPIIDVSEFAELLQVGAADTDAPRVLSLPARTKPPTGVRQRWLWPALLCAFGACLFVAMRPPTLREEPAVSPTGLASTGAAASPARAPDATSHPPIPAPMPEAPIPAMPAAVPPTPEDAQALRGVRGDHAHAKPREHLRMPPVPSALDEAREPAADRDSAQAQPHADADSQAATPIPPEPYVEPATSPPPSAAVVKPPPPVSTQLPLQAHARITELEVRGSLPTALARRAVERIRGQLAACYTSAARGDGRNAFGSLQVQLELDETARARNVRVTGGRLPGLDRCVSEVAARVRSERAPDTGTVKTSWKVVFEP